MTITQLDPIAVAFSLPQRNLGDALATLRAGGGKVTAVLPDSAGTVDGKLQFVDNAVDAASGTVRVKAEFANKDEQLWPGAFVTVRAGRADAEGRERHPAGGDHPERRAARSSTSSTRRQGSVAAGRDRLRRAARTPRSPASSRASGSSSTAARTCARARP